MGKLNILQKFDFISAPKSDAGRRPFADAVGRDDGCFFKGRGIEGAGRVRVVVAGEQHIAAKILECILDVAAHPQFLFDPERHGLDERGESPRRILHVGFEDTLEFQKRFVVEDHVIQVG